MRIQTGRQLAALLLLSAAAGRASAQEWEWSLRPGDRVRVTHTDGCCRSPLTGTLVALGPDSLVFTTGRGTRERRFALPRQAVRTFDRGLEAGSHATPGMVLGGLTGVGTAAVALAIMGSGCEDTGCLGWMLLAPYAVGSGAIIGGVVGRLVGRSVPRIEWRRMPLPARLGIAPTLNGGLAVGLTLR